VKREKIGEKLLRPKREEPKVDDSQMSQSPGWKNMSLLIWWLLRE